MKNIKIVYQYDGSKFEGFQRQNKGKTVQGEIEKILFQRFSEKVNMISSGRTDKGVHATGQVSNFLIEKNIPVEAIRSQINKNLYGEVKILEIEEVGKEFNSRFDAQRRIYLYIMKKKEEITPFEASYIAGIKDSVDGKILEKIMKVYIGKHDFSSFMKKDKALRNTIREIYDVKCVFDENTEKIKIKISGSSFLKTMVRIMIGSALAVYFKEKDEDYIIKKLENPDADGGKILAPAEGLYLYRVDY